MQNIACPRCGASFLGEEIPEDERHLYGGNTHFGTGFIWVQIRGVYDGALYLKCTECKWSSPRVGLKRSLMIESAKYAMIANTELAREEWEVLSAPRSAPKKPPASKRKVREIIIEP